MNDEYRSRAYPPSILMGGAALVVTLAAIVVAVLLMSASSVGVRGVHPAAPPQRPTPTTSVPAATAVAVEPETGAPLDGLVSRLIPQFPDLDRLLAPSPEP